MILSSTCSSMDPVDSAPVNSLVSQSSERSIEEGAFKEKEKQMIVNNYYITDGKEDWIQLEKSEIPPKILNNKMQGKFGEVLPEKSHLNDFNTQSSLEKEAKNLDRDRRNMIQAIAESKGFYGEEAEIQKMSSPPTYNPNYPSPNRYSGNQETAAMLDCI